MIKLILAGLLFYGAVIRASEVQFVEEPKNCFVKKQFPCAIRFVEWGQSVVVGTAKIFPAKNASFVLDNEDAIRILEGSFLIEGHEKTKIDLGLLIASTNGELWLEKSSSQKIFLACLSGEAKINSPFVHVDDMIPEGYEKWYSGMNSKGQVEQGIATAINGANFFPQWNKLTALPKAEAQQKIKNYQQSWKGQVEAASVYYKELVGRQIASIQAREEAHDRQIEKEREERAKLRLLFRQKNYVNP